MYWLCVEHPLRGILADALAQFGDRHLVVVLCQSAAREHGRWIDSQPNLSESTHLVFVAGCRVPGDVLEDQFHRLGDSIERHTPASTHIDTRRKVGPRIGDEDAIPPAPRVGTSRT